MEIDEKALVLEGMARNVNAPIKVVDDEKPKEKELTNKDNTSTTMQVDKE